MKFLERSNMDTLMINNKSTGNQKVILRNFSNQKTKE